MNRLVIRTDANLEIGGGHFSRCFSIAEMLKNDFSILFVISTTTDNFLKILRDHDYSYVSIEDDGAGLLNVLEPSDLFLVDSYDFLEKKASSSLKGKCKRLICVDDLNIFQLDDFDLILNHNFFAKSENYSEKYEADLALGPDFAMLRNAFLEAVPNKLNSEYKIFITMGGSDSLAITKDLTKGIGKFLKSDKAAVVMGGGEEVKNDFEKFLESEMGEFLGNIELFQGISADKMKDLMDASDLIICPASVTLMESCYRKKKVITGHFVDNHVKNADAASSLEGIVNIGDLRDIDKEKLERTIEEILGASYEMSDRPDPSHLVERIRSKFL